MSLQNWNFLQDPKRFNFFSLFSVHYRFIMGADDQAQNLLQEKKSMGCLSIKQLLVIY